MARTPERNRRSLPRIHPAINTEEGSYEVPLDPYEDQLSLDDIMQYAESAQSQHVLLTRRDWIAFCDWLDGLTRFIHITGDGPDSFGGRLMSEVFDAVVALKERREPSMLPPATVGRRQRVRAIMDPRQ